VAIGERMGSEHAASAAAAQAAPAEPAEVDGRVTVSAET
jgi:hypothetical protein